MVRSPPSQLVPHFRDQLRSIGLDCDDAALLEGVIVAQRERAKTLKEMALNSRFFFAEDIELDPKAAAKHLTAEQAPLLSELRNRLEKLSDWNAPAIHDTLTALTTEKGLSLGKVAQPLRVAMSGGTVSPPIDATVALIGRERALRRLDRAVEQCGRAAV
jgi:glutamyl-tRNA synthetase